jgi:DNA-directed RNA polymerase subunit RPC12/RpoP
VPASEDLLFGKIAVAKGYCTQAQIDECILMQTYEENPPPVGDVLLYKGYITADQHRDVLATQQQQLTAEDPATKVPKEALLFGKLAARQGLVTQDQLNECLRIQAKAGETRSLGEIMISRGYLSAEQVKELLSHQLKRIMVCLDCRLSFTVMSISDTKQVECPRCRKPLQEAKADTPARTDAEFSTMVLRAVKAGLPSPVKPVTRPMPAVTRTVKTSCVICDKAFEGAVDATGRVRCPDCHTVFTPR